MTFDEIIEHFGNQANACNAVGLTKQCFQGWLRRGGIPIQQQFRLEKITDGVLVANPLHMPPNKYTEDYKRQAKTKIGYRTIDRRTRDGKDT